MIVFVRVHGYKEDHIENYIWVEMTGVHVFIHILQTDEVGLSDDDDDDGGDDDDNGDDDDDNKNNNKKRRIIINM